jgi:histidinol-phosphate aminotransferase
MKSVLRNELLVNAVYVVPDSAGFIKLDAMESPFAWPGEFTAQWQAELADVQLNRYPDPMPQLRAALCAQLQVQDEQLVLGNGSDELIQLLCMAVAKPNAKVLAPMPSFSMYRIITQACGLEFIGVDLDAYFALAVDAMLTAIREHQPALIFLAVPNNPTGNLFDEVALQKVIEAAPGLVVIDEAYTAFSPVHYAAWLARYPQLIILRTLSKIGLAGIRLGYMAAARDVVQVIERIRLPYNINTLTAKTAAFALQHAHYFQQQAQQVMQWREQLYESLLAMPCLRVWPSHTNFLMLQLQQHDAQLITQQLREAGILIKKLHGSHPLLDQCLRVSLGLPEENQRFIAMLSALLAQPAIKNVR